MLEVFKSSIYCSFMKYLKLSRLMLKHQLQIGKLKLLYTSTIYISKIKKKYGLYFILCMYVDTQCYILPIRHPSSPPSVLTYCYAYRSRKIY